ncbi:MAG: response regulator [Calditrichaeota bacterium]|nr:MAG: response regulator [Calditrichota bacterium]
MNRIIILNEELESQMRMYLALSDRYRVDIAEDEANLMRMIRRKKPKLVLIDANFSGFNNNGKSIYKIIQKIKRKYQDLKIITILNGEDSRMLDRIHEIGSDGVLLRPVDEESVTHSVSCVMNHFESALN